MATIPIYRQQTDPGGPVSLGRVSPAAAAPAEALTAVGAQLARYAQDKREEFDTLRAEEAFNQLRERQMTLMLDPEKGFAAQKSKNAARQGFAEEYLEGFKKAETEISGTLQSDGQRRLFQRRAAAAGSEYRNALMRHVLQESNQYAQEVYQGIMQVEADRSIKEWDNPYSIQSSMDRIESAVAARAKRDGLAADATEALLRDARSKVHTGVIAAALEAGNIAYAEKYLGLNAPQMNAMDLLRTQGLVKKEADTRYALGTATAVVQGLQQQANPDDMERLFSLQEHQESGGRQAAVSPAGAVGVMQVMRDTGPEAAKLAGLPWDEGRWKNDENYNRAIGRAYMAKQLQTFGGDVEKALAAYNAGPGTVSNAIAKASTEGKPGEWRAYMREFQSAANFKQTSDYLAAILPKFTAGGSNISRPTLEQVHQQVRARVGDSNPERLKLAIDESTRQWNDANNARKQREDESLGEAFRLLESNGGRWDALPASLKARLPADKFGSLREFAGKVAKGEPVETNWDVYYQLRTDPALLQKTNLLALKPALNDAEFKELSRQQQELGSGKDQTPLQTTNQRMSMRLSEMGVDPTPRAGSGDAKKVAQVWSLLDQRVRSAEAVQGRKLKPDELEAQVDGLFTTVEVKGALWGSSTRRTFELKPTDQVVVPDADRKQILDALQKTSQPVTEERVLYYYKRAKGLL